jgi:hypothetical protein
VNPDSLAGPVRLNTDWMFRLPTLVRPELLDAISFEDTETALARFLGGLLPAEEVRTEVTGPGGAAGAQPGDLPPVRFGSPRPNRTEREHPVADRGEPMPSTVDSPQGTSRASGVDPPVTRLTRGAAGLADVLRSGSGVEVPDRAAPATTRPSTMDRTLRPGPNQGPEPERQVPTDVDHQEPGGPSPDPAEPARLGPAAAPAAPEDGWPGPDTEDLAVDVLDRLLDLVELDFHRSYGLGEW